MSRITINNMRMHAYHGCWEEEAIIGGDYVVDVALTLDFSGAAAGDDLSQTADLAHGRQRVGAHHESERAYGRASGECERRSQ